MSRGDFLSGGLLALLASLLPWAKRRPEAVEPEAIAWVPPDSNWDGVVSDVTTSGTGSWSTTITWYDTDGNCISDTRTGTT